VAEENSSGEGGGLFAVPDLTPLKRGMEKAGATAKGLGINAIARKAIVGYFSTRFEQLRPDQLQTVLDSGNMLADMIDEDNQVFQDAVNLLSTFGMSRKEVAQAVESFVTPRLVAEAVREADQEAYNQIMTHSGGGQKFFINQTRYLKRKIINMLRRSQSGR